MNIDKSCYNSFCEPAATERRSKKLTDYLSYLLIFIHITTF